MVGDPFKHTATVALNPVTTFTRLFGLLAIELALGRKDTASDCLKLGLALAFLITSEVFAHRSFCGMRIETSPATEAEGKPERAGAHGWRSRGNAESAAPEVSDGLFCELPRARDVCLFRLDRARVPR